MIEMKTLSLFQGNPQNNNQIPDFWSSLTQKTQLLCTSNSYLQGPKITTKKDATVIILWSPK